MFSCDCFIRGNNGNSLDELLRSLSFETNNTTPKFHPKLFVVHPNRDSKSTTFPPVESPSLEVQQPAKVWKIVGQ